MPSYNCVGVLPNRNLIYFNINVHVWESNLLCLLVTQCISYTPGLFFMSSECFPVIFEEA